MRARPRLHLVNEDEARTALLLVMAHVREPMPLPPRILLQEVAGLLHRVRFEAALLQEIPDASTQADLRLATHLRLHLRARLHLEHEAHEARARIVGLGDGYGGAPVAAVHEVRAHALGGGLALLAAEGLAQVGADVRLQNLHRLARALHACRSDANAWSGGDGGHRVRTRGPGPDALGHARLEIAALRERERDVLGGLIEAGRPERFPRTQARRPADGAGLDHAVALDAYLGQQRGLEKTEDHVHARRRRRRLDDHVRVLAGRVEQLDHMPDELGVEGLSGLDLEVAGQTRLVHGVALEAHGSDDRRTGRGRRGRRRPRQDGGEDERAHRACRRSRRSNP